MEIISAPFKAHDNHKAEILQSNVSPCPASFAKSRIVMPITRI